MTRLGAQERVLPSEINGLGIETHVYFPPPTLAIEVVSLDFAIVLRFPAVVDGMQLRLVENIVPSLILGDRAVHQTEDPFLRCQVALSNIVLMCFICFSVLIRAR